MKSANVIEEPCYYELPIKANVILNAWHNYCMTSRIFRILRFFGLRN